MKRVIPSLAITLGLSLAPLALAAAPAEADTPRCAAKAEFKKVRKGWTSSRVQRVFDISGRRTSYFPSYPELGINAEQTREYKPCTKYSYVSISYEKRKGVWRVTGKTGFWM